jgi:fibro-slime domain-containing protein
MPKWQLVAVCVCEVLTSGCSASSDPGSRPSGTGAGTSTASGASGGTLQLGTSGSPDTGSGGSLSLGGMPMAEAAGAPDAAQTCDGKLTGYVRDFNAAQHPDFEPTDFTFPMRASGKYLSDEPGIVEAMLGADQKPVYAKGDGHGSATTTGAANFASWFHDILDLNQGQKLTLQFTKDPNDPSGKKWFYDSATTMGFFPIDGQLLGAEPPINEGLPHNYHFTFELHTVFKYQAGQVFRFRGDDDVWIFINSKNVVDLGGIHVAEERTVELGQLGLIDGQDYPLDGFFAERHVTDSNFSMETSLEFVKCDIVVPK